jgi:hypothetical protein
MRSHLTRLVFRSIIANEPLLYRGCRHRVARALPLSRPAPRAFPQIQRRTFLDLFKPRRKLKPFERTAGLEPLSELHHALKNGFRPPETEALADALKTLFARRKGPFEGWHVERAHGTFQYLLENPRDDGQPWLNASELNDIFQKLTLKKHRPETGGSEHISFGKAILSEYANLSKTTTPVEEQTSAGGQALPLSDHVALKMIKLLSAFGGATEARDIAAKVFPWSPEASHQRLHALRRAWEPMLVGIIREANADEILATTMMLQDLSIPVTPAMQKGLVAYFSEQRDLENAKFWYAQSVMGKPGEENKPQGSTSAALLKACAQSGDIAFGQQLVASLLKSSMPDKSVWDAVFVWSAAIGKGVDEVDRMMGVMVRRNDEARNKDPAIDLIRPDVDTINALVEFAISKQDPYTAERYMTLGEKRGITPNEKTYTMQIQYRLSVKDIDGARAAYFNLQGEFSGAQESVAVINQLIRALCEEQQHHFDELMVMVDDLRERDAIFPPETIAALCVLHFRRGEDLDAKDLLQQYAHSYSPEQRVIICKALLAFITNGETSTADAWDCYQSLRIVFGETPRSDRIKIMNEFFARKRSDMACHVFFHMRNHTMERISANKEVYIAAFTGFARCADAESLELAHNQMKLDYNIDVDTRLRNALMLAYASTGGNIKALQFWRDICESKEGPSYNSIAIAFRSCEGMHQGWAHARAIWKRLVEQDVEIDKTIWLSYMRAITRNHLHDEAQALIEAVEEDYGFKPDLEM